VTRTNYRPTAGELLGPLACQASRVAMLDGDDVLFASLTVARDETITTIRMDGFISKSLTADARKLVQRAAADESTSAMVIEMASISRTGQVLNDIVLLCTHSEEVPVPLLFCSCW